jgi:Tol biopolymer transport system component/DNA-binding winged helix-turn-helix (wHTH) protein
MSGQRAPKPYRQRVFGPFAFDEASGELRKHGIRVRLRGQPRQILEVLLLQPGSIVSRDEFQQQLWSSSTFVDFEHGLNGAMNRLRQVLGDSADQPRYIETLPGQGYRFIEGVHDSSSEPILVVMRPVPGSAIVEASSPSSPTIHSTAKSTWLLWSVGLVVVLTLGYLVALRPPPKPSSPILRFSISPPPGYSIEAASSRQTFALSPDGTQLAFTAANASGIFQAFVRNLDGLDSKPLPNAAGSYTVFWARDGRSLFFTASGSLRRSALDGDSYQVICDAPPITFGGALMGPNLLISSRWGNYVAPLSGGAARAIKELYPWPELLPDGKHLLYTVFDASSGHHRARVVEYGNPAALKDLQETDSRVMYAPSVSKPATGYLIYVRAGNLLAQPFDPRSLRVYGEPLPIASSVYSFFPTGAADFSISNNGLLAYQRYLSRSQLAWVNRRGEVVRTIGPANVNLKHGRLSPDGKKVATAIFDLNRGVFDIWVIDLESGASRRAIVGRGLVSNPVWAPDSQKLVFNGAYDSPPKLFLRGIGENDAVESLPTGDFQVPSDWSSDGRYIAYTNTSFAQVQNEMHGSVWLIDTARGRMVVPLLNTTFHETAPAFSPDCRWLAFTSNESGRTEVYLQAFAPGESPRLIGERHLVSRQGAVSLRWRRDGKELFYLALDGRVYAVPITLGSKPKIGKATPLFAIGTEARLAIHDTEGFDVSLDGQEFLVPITTSSEHSEIVVVQNWEAEALRKHGKLN